MIVTEAWLRNYATSGRGWTVNQLRIIAGLIGGKQQRRGVPRKGWIRRIAGMDISEAHRLAFEGSGTTVPVVAVADKILHLEALPGTGRKKQKRRLSAVVAFAKRAKAPRSSWTSNIDPNSDEFLSSYEWRRLRMEVIKERGRRCECCGATPADGVTAIHVDHVKPRRLYPVLALDKSNLQVLCGVCNHGKGNWDMTDWRSEAPVTSSLPETPAVVDPATYEPCWAPHVARFDPQYQVVAQRTDLLPRIVKTRK